MRSKYDMMQAGVQDSPPLEVRCGMAVSEEGRRWRRPKSRAYGHEHRRGGGRLDADAVWIRSHRLIYHPAHTNTSKRTSSAISHAHPHSLARLAALLLRCSDLLADSPSTIPALRDARQHRARSMAASILRKRVHPCCRRTLMAAAAARPLPRPSLPRTTPRATSPSRLLRHAPGTSSASGKAS